MPRGVRYPPELRQQCAALFAGGQTPAQVYRAVHPLFPSVHFETVRLWGLAYQKSKDAAAEPGEPGPGPALAPGPLQVFTPAKREPSLPAVIKSRIAEVAAGVVWTGPPAPFTADPKLLLQLLEGLAFGVIGGVSAQAAGTTAVELDEWLTKGARGREPFLTLLRLCDRAQAIGVVELHAAVMAGDVTGQQRARWAAWILERRRPEEYQKRQQLSVKDDRDELEGLTNEELESLLRRDRELVQ